jgi:hypothetical protein
MRVEVLSFEITLCTFIVSLSTTAVMECAGRSTIPMRQSNCVEEYDERDALYNVYSKLTTGHICSCEKCFGTDAQSLFRAVQTFKNTSY